MAPITTIQAAALQQFLSQLAKQGMPGAEVEPFRPGEIVPGRVSLGPGGERLLLLAGVRVPATLPDDVPLNRALRFEVVEAGLDRLVLKVADGAGGTAMLAQLGAQEQASATPTPWAAFPLPGGAQARFWLVDGDEEEGANGAARETLRTMVVRYDAPALGRVDIVLRMGEETLEVITLAAAGLPLRTVRGETAPLRDALTAATGRTVSLTTAARTEEDVDVRV